MATSKGPTGNDLHRDVVKKARKASNDVMEGGPDGTFSAGPMVGNWIKDTLKGKKPGTSVYEERRDKGAAKYRREALLNKAKDERKATGQAEANKRYKKTGSYGA